MCSRIDTEYNEKSAWSKKTMGIDALRVSGDWIFP